jgi:hypothetical protein
MGEYRPNQNFPELNELDASSRISLCEALDRILNKGAVVMGEISISVANVDLLYVGLHLVVASMETLNQGNFGGGGALGLSLGLQKEKLHVNELSS